MFTEGTNLRNSGRYKEAKKIYEKLLRNRPKDIRAISGLCQCLAELGQSERAFEVARRALKSNPDNLNFINEFIVMLFNAGKIEESLEWAKRAVKMGPEGAKTNVLVANCYEKLHRIDDALEANRLAQIANPQTNYLKFQEAKLIARKGEYERARDILRETSQAPGLPPELKAQIFGELGRVLDKLKNYDQAYEAFSQSGHEAASNPKTQKFNLGYRPGLMAAFVKGLTEERLKKWKSEDLKDDSWTPAFLVGFPRSGTTMTEQILAAHSGICTTDEQPYFEHVRMEWARIVGANPDLGWMADQLDVKSILQLRKIYREKVEADQQSPIGSKMLIDKLPLNIMNIGLINLVFPEAKIIVALRDPRDCCLSSFMQDFKLNSAMIHFLALDRAVNFYTQVMGTWLHFRDIISLSHFTIRYEDTVKNLEFEAKRLIDYLGLDWEPDILQFHQRAKERVIATPSYVAVTEPVHTRAIGRWKNYHQQFAPLLPKLEPFIREFGYEIDG
jgi:Tfp pilus assembly protein PilF